jgi:uncharacterized membrane protein YgcG
MFRCSPVVLLAAWLGLVGPALAVFPPPVKDEGKFFSADALEKANKKIKDIYQKYKKDVVVETIASLSADQAKKLEELGKVKFFRKFADDRAAELGVNGIYILFSKNPQHYEIVIDRETQKKAFTRANYQKLAETIVKRFKESKFDAGLLDGLDVIEESFKANHK